MPRGSRSRSRGREGHGKMHAQAGARAEKEGNRQLQRTSGRGASPGLRLARCCRRLGPLPQPRPLPLPSLPVMLRLQPLQLAQATALGRGGGGGGASIHPGMPRCSSAPCRSRRSGAVTACCRSPWRRACVTLVPLTRACMVDILMTCPGILEAVRGRIINRESVVEAAACAADAGARMLRRAGRRQSWFQSSPPRSLGNPIQHKGSLPR